MGRNSKDNSLQRYEEAIKISVRYHDYLTHPRLKIRLSSGGESTQLSDAVKYVKCVRRTLDNLNPHERQLISKEFLDVNPKPFWWAKYYSRSTYYRLRNSAIRKFVEGFEL